MTGHIKPLKVEYFRGTDTTTIYYEEMIRNKTIEKLLTIKGRIKERTEYDLIELIIKKL